MSDFTRIDQYIEDQLSLSLDELGRLVAQPSVAAQNWGLIECAALVSEMLKQRGFEVQIQSTAGAPVVYGERMLPPGSPGADKTLLIYNHYDVQPAKPLELWDTPAFEPSLREGKLYGRGVSDDKGHLVSRLHAIDALLATDGELPCNIKFIIEGEEEVSSIHLKEYIHEHAAQLAADACIWEFGGVDHREAPMQYLGLRGICYIELSVETAEPVYGVPMQVVPLTGGSGPNHPFIEILKVPVVSAGISYPGTKGHAPNENIRIDLYVKGAKHIARIIKRFAAQE